MVSFIKSVTFDCREPLVVAAFRAEVLGSNVNEDSTPDRAWVEPADRAVRVSGSSGAGVQECEKPSALRPPANLDLN